MSSAWESVRLGVRAFGVSSSPVGKRKCHCHHFLHQYRYEAEAVPGCVAVAVLPRLCLSLRMEKADCAETVPHWDLGRNKKTSETGGSDQGSRQTSLGAGSAVTDLKSWRMITAATRRIVVLKGFIGRRAWRGAS